MPFNILKYLFFYTFTFLGFFQGIHAQVVSQGMFIPPVDTPLLLSGTFGELRNNHFHAGIDIRTGGVEGIPVHASAEGYLARIRISPFGYGKAIYLNHPNGFTTVYAHLHSFIPELEKFTDSIQKLKGNYEIEIFPDSGKFNFKQGDKIGLTGNTGGSEGPHLHFEIRDTYSEEPLNPQLFGINIPDTITPVANFLAIYVKHNSPWVITDTINTNSFPDTIKIFSDTIAVGINISDHDSSSRLGVYETMVCIEDSVVYNYRFDRFAFHETRFVNAHLDYGYKKTKGDKIQRLFSLPGNTCSIFRYSGNGEIVILNGETKTLSLYVRDFKGNTFFKKFIISNQAKDSILPISRINNLIDFNSPCILESGGITVEIPSNALYENAEITTISTRQKNAISDRIRIGDASIALHKPIKINFPMNFKVPIWDQLLIAETDSAGKILNTNSAKFQNGIVSGFSRNFGYFHLITDVKPPDIYGISYMKDPVTFENQLAIKIRDDISGISLYKSYLNRTSVIPAYDAKSSTLLVKIPSGYGPHHLCIDLTDNCNNFSSIEINF